MAFISCKERKSSPKQRRKSKKHCCSWRNPILVFFLTFGSLWTLRFRRVPAPTKQQAVDVILHFKEYKRKRKHHDAQQQFVVQYKLVEEGVGSNSNGSSFQRYQVLASSRRLSGTKIVTVQEWAEFLMSSTNTDATAIAELNDIIRKCPYEAVFFETPAVTAQSVSTQPMEFILMDAPQLQSFTASQGPDFLAFSTPCQESVNQNENACTFPNLGHDAVLIAPKPPTATNNNNNNHHQPNNSHLASFVRTASDEQISAVWKMAAQSYLDRISQQQQQQQQEQQQQEPVWFSTCGTGISWLHIRLDSTPKYYSFQPYRDPNYFINKNKHSTGSSRRQEGIAIIEESKR